MDRTYFHEQQRMEDTFELQEAQTKSSELRMKLRLGLMQQHQYENAGYHHTPHQYGTYPPNYRTPPNHQNTHQYGMYPPNYHEKQHQMHDPVEDELGKNPKRSGLRTKNIMKARTKAHEDKAEEDVKEATSRRGKGDPASLQTLRSARSSKTAPNTEFSVIAPRLHQHQKNDIISRFDDKFNGFVSKINERINKNTKSFNATTTTLKNQINSITSKTKKLGQRITHNAKQQNERMQDGFARLNKSIKESNKTSEDRIKELNKTIKESTETSQNRMAETIKEQFSAFRMNFVC